MPFYNYTMRQGNVSQQLHYRTLTQNRVPSLNTLTRSARCGFFARVLRNLIFNCIIINDVALQPFIAGRMRVFSAIVYRIIWRNRSQEKFYLLWF